MAIAVTELTWRDQVEFQASRKDIRTVIQTRFGQVSPTMQAALQSMQSEEALDAFLRRAAAAPTEDELVEYARRQALEAGDVAATESVALTWRDQIELEAVTRAKREDIRAIIQLRFGQVSPAVEAALESMRQQAALDAFLRRAAVASIEDELLEQPT